MSCSWQLTDSAALVARGVGMILCSDFGVEQTNRIAWKMMRLLRVSVALLAASSLVVSGPASAIAASFTVGAAPKGNALVVASRVIKFNFPSCKKVSDAKRKADGSITATCNEAAYLVFTVFNPTEGRTIELAINCTAAKKRLNISCK